MRLRLFSREYSERNLKPPKNAPSAPRALAISAISALFFHTSSTEEYIDSIIILSPQGSQCRRHPAFSTCAIPLRLDHSNREEPVNTVHRRQGHPPHYSAVNFKLRHYRKIGKVRGVRR